MNEQEKVYKVIQAAVKKLQEKGVEINEEQFVKLIQDTYKKAATKEEGDKAVKDMFAEIFKDEKKMFKDGGKMESAVNLFKCGGKSKSSKKVKKGQEGLVFYGQNYMNRPDGGYFVYGTDLSNPDYSSDDKYMMIALDKPGDNIGVKISGNDTIPLVIPKTKYTRNEGMVVSDPTLKKAIINAVERENQIYHDVDPIIGQKAYGSDIYGRTVTVPGQKGRYNMFEDDNIRYESVETPDGRVVKVVDENDLPPGYYNRPIFYDGHGISEYGLKNQDSLRTVFETLLKDPKTYPHVSSYKYFYDNYRKSKKKVDKKQNGGYIQPDVSTPNREILYKHHAGPHTPLVGVREKYGEWISEPMDYKGVLKDGTPISASTLGSKKVRSIRFFINNGNVEEEFGVPPATSDYAIDSAYSRTIVDPKTGSKWSESAWRQPDDGKWRVRRWDPEYRRNVTPEEFKETIKRFREGWKNIESQNPAIIRITENDD